MSEPSADISLPRRLIYIPVIHARIDLGSSAALIADESTMGQSSTVRQEWETAIQGSWKTLEGEIPRLPLDWPKVRLYQDGLPVCGREREIVSELAGQGSANYGILESLVHQGANLEGTEDPRLLLQERSAIKRIEEARDYDEKASAVSDYRAAAASLLEDRDRSIADRITLTLRDGETGLLFIGMLHRVDRWLPESIAVEFVFHHLPFEASPWRFTCTALSAAG